MATYTVVLDPSHATLGAPTPNKLFPHIESGSRNNAMSAARRRRSRLEDQISELRASKIN